MAKKMKDLIVDWNRPKAGVVMRREALTTDFPYNLYSQLPKITCRVLRAPTKETPYALTEVRMGHLWMFFSGSHFSALASVIPDKDRKHLTYEQYALNNDRGHELMRYLEMNEVVFEGGPYTKCLMIEFNRHFHRLNAERSSFFTDAWVSEKLEKLTGNQ